MSEGIFRTEAPDIVRLQRGRGGGRERSGWINVGTFALRIVTNSAGDITVDIYPCGTEENSLGTAKASRHEALMAGAIDVDHKGT